MTLSSWNAFLVRGGLALWCGLAVACFPAAAAERPNIILCMGDDHGWEETGYNGHPHVKTPVLDEMAKTGLRLDHFYAAHPSCSPTRGSVLTGRHPNRYGTFVPNRSIRPQETTIAHRLHKAGYLCGHFGKWHLGPVKAGSPTNPGAMGFHEWLSHDNFFELDPQLSRNGGPPQKFEGESSKVCVDAALQFIEKAKKQGKPFFVVLWFGSPHEPYSGLKDDLAMYDGLPEEYAKRFVRLTSNETGRPVRRPLRAVLRERFAEITAMDRSIGTLRTALKKQGLRQNTLLWYCGDNGTPASGLVASPFRGRKGQMYEGGIRVPGVIEWPARITKPMVSKTNTVTSDMLPTLCALTGQPVGNRPLDGISLVPLLEGKMTKRPQPIGFWSFHLKNEAKTARKPYIPAKLQEGTTPLVKMMAGRFTRNFQNFHHPEVAEHDYEGPRVLLDNNYKLVDAQLRFLPSRFDLNYNAVDIEGTSCSELACPNCHLSLSRSLLELPPLFLSILGAPGSGKSYFLASMVWQLRRTLSNYFRLSFADADPDANQILNDYEETLFINPNGNEFVALPKTEKDGDLYDSVRFGEREVWYPRPFVFTLQPSNEHPHRAQAARLARALCLYDNAGEHFLPGGESPNSPGTQHLGRSEALMFLFDPTQHPNFRHLCQGKTDDPQMGEYGWSHRQDQVLHEAAKRIRTDTGLAQRDRTKQPLIVVLTKYDAWCSLTGIPRLKTKWAIREFANDRVGLFLNKISEISNQARSMLKRHAPELISAAEGFSEDVIYIPVSALGRGPELTEHSGLGVRPKYVEPMWSEVPMLYALYRAVNGLIPDGSPRDTPGDRGLKQGSRGFCTVLSTDGMAGNLAERLESLSGYRHAFPMHDPNAHLNPVNYSHVAISVGGSAFHVLSRISDAGKDYTGRSNKLAHHVALSKKELVSCGPAALLAHDGFCRTEWDERLQVCPEGPGVPDLSTEPAACTAWQQAAGDAGWGGVLAESALDGGRPMSVIFPAGTDTLALVVEAMNLLPPEKRWQVTFSTYFTKLPAGVNCHWRFLLAGTQEAAAIRRNPHAPLIDLSDNPGAATGGELVDAARSGQPPWSRRPATGGTPPPMPTESEPEPRETADRPESGGPYRLLSRRRGKHSRDADQPARPPRLASRDRTKQWLMILGGLAIFVVFSVSIVGGYLIGKSAGARDDDTTSSTDDEPGRNKTGNDKPAERFPENRKTGLTAVAPDVQTPDVVPQKTVPDAAANAKKTAKSIPGKSVAKVAGKKRPKKKKKPRRNFLATVQKLNGEMPLPAYEEGAVGKPAALVRSAVDPKAITLSLHGGESILSPGSGFRLTESSDDGAARKWTVEKFAKGAGSIAVAEFSVTPKQLAFAWTFNRRKPDVDLLRYCVLEISNGSKRAYCRLAKPHINEPIHFSDLTARNTYALRSQQNLPHLPRLRLDVQVPAQSGQPMGVSQGDLRYVFPDKNAEKNHEIVAFEKLKDPMKANESRQFHFLHPEFKSSKSLKYANALADVRARFDCDDPKSFRLAVATFGYLKPVRKASGVAGIRSFYVGEVHREPWKLNTFQKRVDEAVQTGAQLIKTFPRKPNKKKRQREEEYNKLIKAYDQSLALLKQAHEQNSIRMQHLKGLETMDSQSYNTEIAPPETVEDYRRLIDDIQEILSSFHDPDPDDVEAVHARYAAAIDVLNTRLHRCDDLLNKGYRGEAIQEGEREPNLLDLVSILDFPDAILWLDYAEQFGLAKPRPLMVGVAADLNDAYNTDQALEGLLNRYRVYTLARCPLSRRLGLLRKIAKKDAANPIWQDDLKTFERERHKQIRDELKAAAQARDTEALSQLESELNNSPWIVKPAANTVDALRDVHTRIRVENARDEMKSLQPLLTDAFSALDVDAGRRHRQRWNALLKLVDGETNGLAELVEPALDWLADEDRRAEEENHFQAAVATLDASLEQGAERATLERQAYEATRNGRDLPPMIAQRYHDRLHDLDVAATRKRRLIFLGTTMCVVLLAGIAGWLIQSSRHQNSLAQHAGNLAELIEAGKLEAATKYADGLDADEPNVAAEPEIRKLRQDLAVAVREDTDRRERLSQMLASAEQAGVLDNTWDGFQSAYTQLKEALPLCKNDSEIARVKQLELQVRRQERKKQKSVDDDFRKDLADLETREKNLAATDLEGASTALAEAGKLETRPRVSPEVKSGGKLALLITRLKGRQATADRLRREATRLQWVSEKIGEPLMFAEALQNYARAFPGTARATSFQQMAQQQKYWLALRQCNELADRWARENLTRLTPAAADAERKRAEKVAAIAPDLAPTKRLDTYLAYLKTVAARKSQKGAIVKPLQAALESPQVTVLWVKLKNGSRYYIKKPPFDVIPKAAVAGTRLDYYTDLALNTAEQRVAVKDIANPTQGETFNWESPQATFARAAIAELRMRDESGWEETFLDIHRLLIASEIDPVLKLQLLQRVIDVASTGSSVMAELFSAQKAAIKAAAVDTTVNWLAPVDEAAEDERTRARKVLKTLKPIEPAKLKAALEPFSRPGLGPRYVWVGWLHKTAKGDWVCKSFSQRRRNRSPPPNVDETMFEFDEQSEYFVRVRGRMQGPFDEAKIRAMIERGRIGRHDQISVDGRHWERAGDWTELFSTRGERKVRQTHEMAATRAGSRHSHADPNDPSSGTSAEEQLWYYNDHDQQYGPLPLAELKQRLAEGEIDPEAYGWTDGMENWEPLSSLPALSSSLRAQPAAPAAPAVAAAPVASAGSEPAGGAAAAPSSDSSFWLIITTILVTIVLVAAVAAGVVLFMQRQGDVEEPDSENAAPAGSQASPADDSKTPDATPPTGGDAKPAPKVAPQPKTPPKSAPAGSPAKKTPAAKTTAGGGVSASEIYERAVKSVFTIVTDKGQGSGFLLAPQMVIVTNSHVIKDASRIEVFDNNRRSDSTAVLVRDDGRDLALLRLPMAFTNRAGLVRTGLGGGKYTHVNNILSAVIAAFVTTAFYLSLLPISETRVAEMFTERGVVPYAIVFLSAWSFSILFVKWRKLALQRRALSCSVVPSEHDFVLSPQTVQIVRDKIDETVDKAKHFILFNRIAIALSNLRNIGRVSDVDEILRSQAEHDESVMENSYSIIRGFVWAIPVLGFIGTVIGLSQAIGGFGSVLQTTEEIKDIKQSLQGVTGGLSTAFETTLQGLVAALVIQLILTFLKKSEQEFLDECAEYCTREIVNKLRVMPYQPQGEQSAVATQRAVRSRAQPVRAAAPAAASEPPEFVAGAKPPELPPQPTEAELARARRNRRLRWLAAGSALLLLLLLLLILWWPDSQKSTKSQLGDGRGLAAAGTGNGAQPQGQPNASGQQKQQQATARQPAATPTPPKPQTGNTAQPKSPVPMSQQPPGLTSPSKGGSVDSDSAAIAGSRFFGLKAGGERFVYIVDCSGSMRGEPFRKAREELLRSIHNLGPKQSFYVIFFASGSFPMFSPNAAAPDLLVASQANVKRVTEWVTTFNGNGGTDPEDAFIKAIELKPDAIFFLTDGAFPDRVVDVVRQKNQKQAAINTVGFQSRSGEPLLKRIAAENSGKYLFVRLRSAAEDRGTAIKSLTSSETARMARELEKQDARHAKLVEQKSRELGQIGKMQIRTNQIATEMQKRRSTIKQQKQLLAGLKRKLQTEVLSHTRSVDLPRLRRTTRKPIAFFLKRGRLYAVHRPGRHASRWENLTLSDEVVKSANGSRQVVDIRPGKGTPTTAPTATLKKKIMQFDPKAHYVQIFVWEDSFKEFVTIRKILVDAKFEYALKPMLKDARVAIGPGRTDEAELPGRGHGSATVFGDRVFIAAAEEKTGLQSLLCFDRATGKPKWKTVIHRGGLSKKGNRKSSQASSTPACDGKRVYINFLNNNAVYTTALDLDGKQLWQTKLTDYVVHQGYGASPVPYGSLLLVSADNKAGGIVGALNRENGEFVWKHRRPKTPNYTSPIVLNVAGKDQVLFVGCNLASSYNPVSGKKNWEIKGATTECVTSTVTDGNVVITSGGYPKNHVSAVRGDGSGEVVWQNNVRVYVPSMVIFQKRLYAVTDAGVAICWDAASGRELWKHRLRGGFTSSLLLAGGNLYATNERGKTFVFKASSKGYEPVAENQLGNQVYATPAVSGDRLFLRVAHQTGRTRQEVLYCIGRR
eukprot:g21950.t1